MKSASRIKLAATVASVARASTRPGAPSISERAHAVPRLVRATIEGTYAGTTVKRLALVAGAVAYVASPVDLLPEAILPVVGAADDAVVIGWAVKAFFEETDRFMAWEVGQGIRRTGRRSAGAGGRSAASQATVPGTTVPGASGGPDAATRVWAGGVDDGLRRDRDTTGAAAPGRIASSISRVTASSWRPRTGTSGTSGTDGTDGTDGTGAGGDRLRLPEGMRQAATDYMLETVRKRLER